MVWEKEHLFSTLCLGKTPQISMSLLIEYMERCYVQSPLHALFHLIVTYFLGNKF